jgi:uncharacterized protein (DUF58 family)
MKLGRRAFEIAGFGAVLAVCAAAFAQPLLLFGAAGVGAWLLGRQHAFVTAAERVDRGLTVRTRPTDSRTTVDDELPVAVTVDLEDATALSVAVEPATPAAATLRDVSAVALEDGVTRAELSYAIEFHVAGRHELPPLDVTLRDERGLFVETVERDASQAVSVRARGPSRLHVGRGASNVSDPYGAESQRPTRQGVELQEIREYLPGDVARNIDWNATARLGELHVRQYGTESTRHATVVLDRREAMGVGPAGETKFDYARELALGLLEDSESLFDTVALYGVDEETIVSQHRSQSAAEARTVLRDPLLRFRPAGTGSGTPTAPTSRVGSHARTHVAGRLQDGTAAFDRKLGPFFRSRPPVEGAHDDPIRTALRREQTSVDGDLGVVLLTDDTDPGRVWETVRFASRTAERVTLFLTPHVLFEPGGLDDLETAYERYLEFEAFRRRLDDLPNVTAFEVGPRDRFRTVVDSRRRR